MILYKKNKARTGKSTNDTLTNTEDVEAESMVDRLVDQLVRHAVKPYMTSQRDSSSTFHLTTTKKTMTDRYGETFFYILYAF